MPNRRLLREMTALRTRFDAAGREARRSCLTAAAQTPIDSADALATYHDLLLFWAAHPDDAAMLRSVESELRRIGQTVEQWHSSRRHAALRKLRDTGIAGSTTLHSFSLVLLRWLIRTAPADVLLDWKSEGAADRLEELLPHLCATTEHDGLLNQRYDTRDWVRLADGNRDDAGLSWLLDRFSTMPAPAALRDQLFDSLEFNIAWRHRDARLSRTGARFPDRPAYFQQEDMLRGVELNAVLAAPLPAARPLPSSAARVLLDACRAALSARRRETDPLTHANEREVTLFRLERGVDVAVFGMTPERRLPIESYFGYVAARNRVPAAYGGGWILGGRCEIGVNIFEEFRGGESAFLFAQIMRVYHHYYGGQRFLVDPFQFGAGNDEAIQSGAFWFYYRLGYRPIDARARKLAEREAERIGRDRTHRSTAATLRRLAQSKLRLDCDHRTADRRGNAGKYVPGDFDLAELGAAVTAWIANRFDGERSRAEDWAVKRIARSSGVRPSPRWEYDARRRYADLAILAAMIDDLDEWTPRECRALGELLRSKCGPTERAYARSMQRHPKCLAALARLAQRRK